MLVMEMVAAYLQGASGAPFPFLVKLAAIRARLEWLQYVYRLFPVLTAISLATRQASQPFLVELAAI